MSNLRIPGPTPLPPQVLKSLSKQMINHRGKSYEEMHKRIVDNLKVFFQTDNDIYLITSSGMGGLEASVANFFSPGDRIISFTCGEFGHRWADVARAFKADVREIRFPSGEAVSVEKAEEVMAEEKSVKGVFITLNETATGVLNPVRKFAEAVKKHPSEPLLLVDSISSLGAVDCPMDDTKIDVLVTASQKAWMAPPGISMISVSPKAWEAYGKAENPRYYFDMGLFRKFSEKNQTPATCALTTLYGLDEALMMMAKEGKREIFRRHLELMEYTRKKVRQSGLELFAKDEDASPTVTSIKVPEGIDAHEWLSETKKEHDVVLAGGMGDTKGKIIRIAHMGYVSREEIDKALDAAISILKKHKKN